MKPTSGRQSWRRARFSGGLNAGHQPAPVLNSIENQLGLGSSQPDLLDAVLSIAVLIFHRSRAEFLVAGLDLHRSLGALFAIANHDLRVVQIELVFARLQ